MPAGSRLISHSTVLAGKAIPSAVFLSAACGSTNSLQGGLDGQVVGGDDVGVRLGPAVGVDRPGEEVDENLDALGLGSMPFQLVAGLPLVSGVRWVDPGRRRGCRGGGGGGFEGNRRSGIAFDHERAFPSWWASISGRRGLSPGNPVLS
jgi:hypothetical protein